MGKKAFIFPGQGSQRAGMGKDFYDKFAVSRDIFDQAGQWLSMDMRKLCFENNDRLDVTRYTQPALVTTCLAIEKVMEQEGIYPDVTAGLSLGEYCAIAAAGGMTPEDAITTVRKRGILMDQAYPSGEGAMAAVLGMETVRIERVLEEIRDVCIANYNCPGQIVITGRRAAVETACESLKASGARRVIPLNVSGPFHSPMLEKAGLELKDVLEAVELSPLKLPYVTNVTASYVTDIRDTKDLLVRQISSPVKWQQSMENMIFQGVDTFIEIGPGKTLAGFLKKINRDVTVYNVQSVEDLENLIGQINFRRGYL